MKEREQEDNGGGRGSEGWRVKGKEGGKKGGRREEKEKRGKEVRKGGKEEWKEERKGKGGGRKGRRKEGVSLESSITLRKALFSNFESDQDKSIQF